MHAGTVPLACIGVHSRFQAQTAAVVQSSRRRVALVRACGNAHSRLGHRGACRPRRHVEPEGRRLPGHLVHEPALRRRVRLQVQRRAGDLLRQAPARSPSIARSVQKTFFCYGGSPGQTTARLLHMVSYYDHARGPCRGRRSCWTRRPTTPTTTRSSACDAAATSGSSPRRTARAGRRTSTAAAPL